MRSGAKVGGIFRVWCYDSEGNLKWETTAYNRVVTVGLQHILDTEFTGATPVGTWYVQMTRGTPTVAAGDTMSSHGGWTEATETAETNRLAWVETRSGVTLTNSASKASYTINASITLGGAFLCSSQLKNSATGILMCAATYTGGDQPAQANDVLQVQYDFSAADDGV